MPPPNGSGELSVPALVMPPVKVETVMLPPRCTEPPTTMSSPDWPKIDPALLMPPEKFDTVTAPVPVARPPTWMPLPKPPPAEMVPELAMPPPNVAMFTVTALGTTAPTRIPPLLVEEIRPALLMPPVKVEPATSTAVSEALMTLALSIAMPCTVAVMLPVSTIAPLIVLARRY